MSKITEMCLPSQLRGCSYSILSIPDANICRDDLQLRLSTQAADAKGFARALRWGGVGVKNAFQGLIMEQ
jgi:hypothetical protein